MQTEELDRLIERLGDIMPDAPPHFVKTDRSDWRPFWELASNIQAGFNSGARYPTKERRQQAWQRFNELRDEANRRATQEQEHIRQQSKQWRDAIFSKCSGITWSLVSDTIFFFDKTNAEQVKRWGGYLGEAMRMLSEHKHEMLGEHKQECFNKMQEIKESHNLFWERYKEAHQARWQENREAFATKTKGNIAANRARLRECVAALTRQRSRADEIRDKLAGATSEKWTGIFEQWLSEAEGKIDSIEASILQIEGWIEEDEGRLRGLD